MHLSYKIHGKEKPLPVFHTMCKKIKCMVVVVSIFVLSKNATKKEYDVRPQRERRAITKRGARKISLVGINFNFE